MSEISNNGEVRHRYNVYLYVMKLWDGFVVHYTPEWGWLGIIILQQYQMAVVLVDYRWLQEEFAASEVCVCIYFIYYTILIYDKGQISVRCSIRSPSFINFLYNFYLLEIK